MTRFHAYCQQESSFVEKDIVGPKDESVSSRSRYFLTRVLSGQTLLLIS